MPITLPKQAKEALIKAGIPVRRHTPAPTHPFDSLPLEDQKKWAKVLLREDSSLINAPPAVFDDCCRRCFDRHSGQLPELPAPTASNPTYIPAVPVFPDHPSVPAMQSLLYPSLFPEKMEPPQSTSPASPQSQPQSKSTQFPSGAVRSSDRSWERYDLITPIGLRRVAQTCHEGAAKYSDFNWEKGMPVHDILNHAIAHIFTYLSGDRSEDHLGHAAWNLLAACHSEELWPTLNAGHLRGPGCVPPPSLTPDNQSLTSCGTSPVPSPASVPDSPIHTANINGRSIRFRIEPRGLQYWAVFLNETLADYPVPMDSGNTLDSAVAAVHSFLAAYFDDPVQPPCKPFELDTPNSTL